MPRNTPSTRSQAAPPADDYAVSDGEWLRIDWAEHLRESTVDSVLGETPVSYVELGQGPPVLLVHGLSGSWRNWLENIPYLARRHRVVALDLPGFGASRMPEYPSSIKSYGNFLVKFADGLGLGDGTALIGHSMGGFISTEATILVTDARRGSRNNLREDEALTEGHGQTDSGDDDAGGCRKPRA